MVYGCKFLENFKFKLPENSKVEECSFSIFADTLFMKVSIDKESTDTFKEELLYNIRELNYYELKQPYLIPNFKNICEWWDMNTEDIYVAYSTFLSGKYKKTVEIYVFLVRNTDQIYLYVAKI